MVGGVRGGGAPESEGTVLAGKYTLEALLGGGAMGEVWRARNIAFGRAVAIKLLRAEHARDPEIVARFLREARAANLVRHANVVDVIDVGEDETGRPFLVQELLEGKDLGAHLSDVGHGLPLYDALEILLPIVEAVAFAHGKGVVHRDLKPENVFLSRTDGGVVPKLLDFGISHVVSEGAVRMTATGVALGTPAYMSPEQIKGARNVDVRSDIWALGVMIHEMLAGELPFKGATVADHFVQVATADPKPLAVAAPHVSSAMARIVAKCLRRAPAQRYPDAGTLLLDLRAVAADSKPDGHAAHSSALRVRQAAETAEIAPSPRAPPSAHHGRREPVVAALELEFAPPLRRAPRFQSIRPLFADAASRRPIASAVLAIGAVVAAGLLAMINPWPDDWALAPLTTSFISGAGQPLAYAVAVLFVGIATIAGMMGWRRNPRSWGHFVLSAGAIAIATVIVAAATGQVSWTVLPGAAAAGAVGIAAVALRGATDAWLDEVRGSAVMFAAAGAAALFVARQLIR
jgi:serine/threonine protein kinase